jgi:hypothetical protein
MGRKGRSDVVRSVPQRGDVSRNKYAISKRDRERNVSERRTGKLAERRAKAAERRDVRADESGADESGAR